MAETKGPLVLTVMGVTTGLAVLTVSLRVYVRTWIVRRFGLDDMLMVLALAISLTTMAFVILQVQNGGGHHAVDLNPHQRMMSQKYQFIGQPLILWTICIVKLSIAAFLLRLSPPERYRRVILGVAIVLGVYTFACFFTIVFQCQPISMSWGETRDGKCFNGPTMQGLSVANLSTNIATDFFFAILPMPMLWHVQMNKRTKVALMAVLGLGIFACACAIIRTVEVLTYPEDDDFLWDSSIITIWSVIESNVGIITGSMPCLKPLFRSFNPSHFDPSDGTITLSGQTLKGSGRHYPRKNGNQLIYTGRPWYAGADDDEATNTFVMVPCKNRADKDDGSEEVLFKNTPGNIIKTTEVSVLDSRKI